MHHAAAPAVTDPAVEPSSISPVPAVPIVIWCSSVVVVLSGAVAAASGAWAISALTILAGAVPFRRDELDLRAAKAASLMLTFVALLSLGSRVMAGGFDAFATAPDWLLGGVVGALALRVLALWQESVRRWVDERWFRAAIEAEIAPAQAVRDALVADPEHRTRTVELAVVALARAPASVVPTATSDRRAFWLNTYNVLAMHATRGRQSNQLLNVLEPYRTRYTIAGRRLSLNDIEHGMLRGNSPMPGWPRRPFVHGDSRSQWVVPLDPRVHFALNCGAKSCPPVRVYHGQTLDEQLRTATLSYLSQETRLDEVKRRLHLSRILQFYSTDFGGRSGVRRFVVEQLDLEVSRVEEASIVWNRYDWSQIF
jgi:Protein of unknown function, DUF547